MPYGTLQIFDTLNARRVAATDLIGLYDQQTLFQQVQAWLTVHNRLMDEMTSDIIDPTTERFLTWGNNATIDMQDGDEFSHPDLQKMQTTPVMMGFPLRIKQVAYGATRLFMETKTLGDLEQVITAARDADIRDRLKSIRAALFNPTNNTTYVDRFVDSAPFTLRALTNADSTYIPPDPYGNAFDGATHTHFLGTGSFAAANLSSLISTVVEHYNNGNIRVYMNKGSEAAVRGFTGFYPYWDQRLVVAADTTHATSTLDMLNLYDRAIGIFDSAEVWVKPWIPANYLFCFNTDAPKPLRLRTRPSASAARGNLRIAAEYEQYPLQATFMEREYGVGVYERTNGACLKTDNATYSAPAAWAL